MEHFFSSLYEHASNEEVCNCEITRDNIQKLLWKIIKASPLRAAFMALFVSSLLIRERITIFYASTGRTN